MQTYQARIRHFVDSRVQQEGTINAMLQMRFVKAQEERRRIVYCFTLAPWEMNPAGHTHGGILSAILDVAMGGAAYAFSQAAFTPTISLAVNFVKGTQAYERLEVEAFCDHIGSRMIMTRAIAYNQAGEVVASANGSYAVNTRK